MPQQQSTFRLADLLFPVTPMALPSFVISPRLERVFSRAEGTRERERERTGRGRRKEKKIHSRRRKKLRESVKGRCDYRSGTTVHPRVGFSISVISFCNVMVSYPSRLKRSRDLVGRSDRRGKLHDDTSIGCLVYAEVGLSNERALHGAVITLSYARVLCRRRQVGR